MSIWELVAALAGGCFLFAASTKMFALSNRVQMLLDIGFPH